MSNFLWVLTIVLVSFASIATLIVYIDTKRRNSKKHLTKHSLGS